MKTSLLSRENRFARNLLLVCVLFVLTATFPAISFAQAADTPESTPEGDMLGTTPPEGDTLGTTPPEGDTLGTTPPEGDTLGTTPENGNDGLAFDLPLVGRTTFSMTSTTTGRFRGNNYDGNPFDDDFWSLQQRFDLALQSREFRLETRLDAFLPFTIFEASRCPSGQESQCYLNWDVRPERITLRYEHESLTLEAGDAQLVVGRGMALSFRKVDLLGVDNALRGGHVRFDDGRFRARVHIGVANPQNQDPLTLRIFQDPDDLFGTASLGFNLNGLSVGGHVVRAWFANDSEGGSSLRDRGVEIVGATAEIPALFDGALALYAEANGMRRSATPLSGISEYEYGRAVYASAQLQLTELTVLLEWKDYRNFLVAPSVLEGNAYRIYSAAPSLEFDGPQRLRGIGNQRGASLRIDYAFLPGPWSVSANTSLFGLAERPEDDPWDGILVSHSWATLQRRQEYGEDYVWSIDLSGGFRHESCLSKCPENEVRGEVDRQMIHGQMELTLGKDDHSFDLVADHRVEVQREFTGALRDFEIGGLSLTYSNGVQFSITLGMRWTDQKANVVTQRAARDYNFAGGLIYPSAEFRWNFDPSNYARLFVGSTPGGLICSGGVCREVPAFEGGLLQLVARL